MAYLGMATHDHTFFGGMGAGLEQDQIGDADFADVVHRRGRLDFFALVRAKIQFLGDQATVFRHTNNVITGIFVAIFTGLRQLEQRFAFAGADFMRGL